MDGAKGEKGDSGEKGEHGDPGPAVSFFLYLTSVSTNLPYSNFPNAGFISLFFKGLPGAPGLIGLPGTKGEKVITAVGWERWNCVINLK